MLTLAGAAPAGGLGAGLAAFFGALAGFGGSGGITGTTGSSLFSAMYSCISRQPAKMAALSDFLFSV